MAREDGQGGSAQVAVLYRYRFGTAEFDAARFELRVDGQVVGLQQKPLQLLAALLAAPGEVLSKNRLFAAVWSDRATGDAVLNNAASKLRAALGPENAGRIVTVPRQGYRFEGPVDLVAVGRRLASRMNFAPGVPVPGRESYLLKSLLGGSAGHESWLARHPKTGDSRVFKFALDGQRLADLKREVTLYRVLHESLAEPAGIVRVVDWNFREAPYWLESEYAGQNLDAWVAEREGDRSRLAAADRAARLGWFLQIADAVASAHGAGVAHEDLKPANVLVEAAADGWRLRLADFGSGRLLEPERLERLQITRMGMTLAWGDAASGTPYYMAPEVGRGDPPTYRSDVFSLGVILYQLLAGDLRRPMVSGWERDVDDALLREDIVAATDRDPDVRLASVAELASRVRQLEARQARRAVEQAAAARSAEAQRRLARARERRAAAALAQQVQVSQALGQVLRDDLIGAANPALGGRVDITVADALSGAASRIDAKFGDLAPAVRGSLHAAMQQALGELSRSAEAVEAGRRALAALRVSPGVNLDQLQAVRLQLAADLYFVSNLDEARAVVRDIDAAPPTAASASPVFRARLLYIKSSVTVADLSFEASLHLLREAFSLLEPLPLSVQTVGIRGKVMFALASDLSMLGRLDESEAISRRLLAEQLARLGEDSVPSLHTMASLANTLSLAGRHAEARNLLDRAAPGLEAALGARHRTALFARDMLAAVRFRERDYPGAANEWMRVHEGYAALQGEGSIMAISARTSMGMALHLAGQPARAEPAFRDALARAQAIQPGDAPQVQQIRYSLANCLLDLQRAPEAAALLEGLSPSALSLAEQEPDWPARLDYQQGRIAMARGDRSTALVLMERAAAGLMEDGDLSARVARGLLREWNAAPLA